MVWQFQMYHIFLFFFVLELQEELNTEGAEFIFKYFDELFSVIEYLDQIDYKQLHYVYENILVKSNLIINRCLLEFNCINWEM